MSFRTKFILTLLSATLTLYTAVGGWISTRAQQPANDPNAQLRIFESVLQHIQNDYVDEPNKDNVVGIGAELSQVASYLYVISPMKGSAADQAGVKAGDIIEYIDNKATRDISLYDAKQLLNGN